MLHRVILFTEWLAHTNWLVQAGFFALYMALITLTWGSTLDSWRAGVPFAAITLGFIMFDWFALAQLPRRGRSFGPIGPPVILFGALRSLFSMALALLAAQPILASMLLLVGQIAITGYALDSMWGEPFRLGVTRQSYRYDKLDNAPPIRILHLTDFHVERLTVREQRVLDLIEELHPDMIVYTGDLLSFSYVDDPRAQADCRRLMSQLQAPLGVYVVPGTPLVDTPQALEAVLGGLDNICLLSDCVISLANYPAVKVIGMSCTHDPAIDGPRLAGLVEGLPAEVYKILLYHAPDLMPEAAQLGIDLVLCGHTHGGQVRLPIFGALFTSSVYWKRYEMGEYREGATTMYVSRGIGMEGKGMPRMRFLCEPEIELIELRGVRMAQSFVPRRELPIRSSEPVPALHPLIVQQDSQ
jgi:predicted MPP superfamily phosphohydrolase